VPRGGAIIIGDLIPIILTIRRDPFDDPAWLRDDCCYTSAPWQCLNFLPDPHGHWTFRKISSFLPMNRTSIPLERVTASVRNPFCS